MKFCFSNIQEELANSLPTVKSSGQKASPVVQELRQLMEEVETIQAERETIESEFTSPSQDMGKNSYELPSSNISSRTCSSAMNTLILQCLTEHLL